MEFLKWQFKLRRTLHLLALCNFLSTRRRGGGGTGKLFSFLSSCPPTPLPPLPPPPPLPLRWRARAPLPLHRSPPPRRRHFRRARTHRRSVSQSVRRHLHNGRRPRIRRVTFIYGAIYRRFLHLQRQKRRMLKQNAVPARMESLFDSHTPDARARDAHELRQTTLGKMARVTEPPRAKNSLVQRL